MGMEYNAILVRLGEYMVRESSSFRSKLVNRLKKSIEKTLVKHELKGRVRDLGNVRIIINDIDPEKINTYLKILGFIPGISSISPAVEIEYIFNKITSVLEEFIREDKPRSIRVIVEGEPGIERNLLVKALTSHLILKYSLYVNLSSPDKEYIVEIRGGKTYVMREKHTGIGGLPYGVEGCLVMLFSGGVDSAVATYFLIKRGVEPIILYNDMGNYWSREAHERFYEALDKIYKVLPWDHVKVYITKGLGDLVVKADIPRRLKCLLCKSLMYIIASRIADREKCLGIASGEVIGQVASQTLSNLYLLSRVIDKPIYRPLTTMDKIEIIKYAEKLGFITLSRNVGQCMLKPDYPETNASIEDYELIKRRIREYSREIDRIIDNANTLIYRGVKN